MTFQMKTNLRKTFKQKLKSSKKSSKSSLRGSEVKKLRKKVQAALDNAGLSWRKLASAADQIVLFGSRAAGCNSQQSDVDLLCVGYGQGKRCRGLHLIWIDTNILTGPYWLTSE